jgi:hypothetical protein
MYRRVSDHLADEVRFSEQSESEFVGTSIIHGTCIRRIDYVSSGELTCCSAVS